MVIHDVPTEKGTRNWSAALLEGSGALVDGFGDLVDGFGGSGDVPSSRYAHSTCCPPMTQCLRLVLQAPVQ